MTDIADREILAGGTAGFDASTALAFLAAQPRIALSPAEQASVVASFQWCGGVVGADWTIAFAQSCLETDNYRFGGQVPVGAHNPAGIGAINDGSSYRSYPDWPTGIAAYWVHLLAWLGRLDLAARVTPLDLATLDPRLPLVASAVRAQGKATTWRSLGGRWAVPGTTYGDGIAARYAAIAAHAPPSATTGGHMAPPIADRTDILPHASDPAKDNRPGDKLTGFHAVVIHETDNEAPSASAAFHRKWLEDSRPQASFQVCVDATESLLILPIDEVCWAIGDGTDQPLTDESFFTVSIEICVNDRAHFAQACARAAKSAAAILVAKNLLPGVSTVRQHGSYWSAANPQVHQGCPKHLKAGDWGVTWAQFEAMVASEYATLAAAPTGDNVSTALTDAQQSAKLLAEQSNARALLTGQGHPDAFGLPLYQAYADLSGIAPGLPSKARCLVCEKAVLWIDGNGRVDTFHRGQFEGLEAAGKTQKLV